MGSEPGSRHKPEIQEVLDEVEGKQNVRTEGILRSRKAVLPSEIRHKERSTEEGVVDDPRGWRGGRSRQEVYTEHVSRLQAEESMQARAREAHKRADANCYAPIQTSRGRYMPNSSKPLDVRNVQKTAFQENPIQDPVREAVPNGDHLSHDARVSVAKLRHTYLESVASPRKAEL